MVQIEFVHVPEGSSSTMQGPYLFVQVTYEVVRVGPEGDTEIAYRTPDGFWRFDDKDWTDFIISSV